MKWFYSGPKCWMNTGPIDQETQQSLKPCHLWIKSRVRKERAAGLDEPVCDREANSGAVGAPEVEPKRWLPQRWNVDVILNPRLVPISVFVCPAEQAAPWMAIPKNQRLPQLVQCWFVLWCLSGGQGFLSQQEVAFWQSWCPHVSVGSTPRRATVSPGLVQVSLFPVLAATLVLRCL